MKAEKPEPRSSPSEGKYTNSFQIGHNAFEFLLEFGQSYADQTDVMHTRLVTSPVFAARLSRLLSEAVSSYEAKFGQISLDDGPK
jgi:hypothetical protein